MAVRKKRFHSQTCQKDHSETQRLKLISHIFEEFSIWPKTSLPKCPSFGNVSSIFHLVEKIIAQVSQLARATVVTSRLARRESKRGQSKALRRMILAELQSQEESYVAAMQALVNGY